MSEKLCLLVCAYLASEVKAVCAEKGFQDVEVLVFPGHCGQNVLKEDLLPVLDRCGKKNQSLVLGGPCLQGLATEERDDDQAAFFHVKDHCAAFFCNHGFVHSLVDQKKLIITPGWLADWRKNMDRGLVSEPVQKIILFDTGIDGNVSGKLKDFADFCNLNFKKIFIGLDYLELLITNHVLKWREKTLADTVLSQKREASDYAMSLDLLGRLTKAATETEAVEAILELFTILFAPAVIFYVPFKKNRPGKIRGNGLSVASLPESHITIPDFSREQYAFTESGRGFWLQLKGRDETLGVLKIDEIQFYQYREHYLNLALVMIDVCSLAIDNTRTYQELTDTARIAGKAEVATDILHNVGNILNSINISIEKSLEILRKSATVSLPEVVGLMMEQQENLAYFLTEDPQGSKLPAYFVKMADYIVDERQNLQGEMASLARNIGHVKTIVRMQQFYAVEKDILERVYLEDLFDDVLQIHSDRLCAENIQVVKEYGEIGAVQTYRHKILQILVNLISNSIDALVESEKSDKKITLILTRSGEKFVRIKVVDNGVGIDKNLLTRIFSFGFSTKRSRHGFGLHSAANLAAVLHGSLTALSAGPGKGASFLLEIPVE